MAYFLDVQKDRLKGAISLSNYCTTFSCYISRLRISFYCPRIIIDYLTAHLCILHHVYLSHDIVRPHHCEFVDKLEAKGSLVSSFMNVWGLEVLMVTLSLIPHRHNSPGASDAVVIY